jgi:hypothetical protein
MNAHTRIRQAAAVEFGHRSFGPTNNGGHKLCHDDPSVGWELLQGSSEREAHAEPADQQSRLRPAPDPRARQRGERLFRCADAAVHQLDCAQHDGKLGASLLQASSPPPGMAAVSRRIQGSMQSSHAVSEFG